MNRHLSVLILLCFSIPSLALASSTEMVPESLKVWKEWLLAKHSPSVGCPYSIEGDGFSHRCIWSKGLTIDVEKDSVRFNLSVSTEAKVSVELPGDTRHWPESVRVNDKEVPVVAYRNYKKDKGNKPGVRPAIWLEPGDYEVKGDIPLSHPIQSLKVPRYVGLVDLTLMGKRIDNIDIDANNALWLKRKTGGDEGKGANNDIQVKVFRKLTDAIPIMLETRLELSVSGKAREISIGQLLLDGSVLTRFDSDLPARIENDGQLRIQVRAGKWSLMTRARFEKPADSFGFEKRSDDWPDNEVWSFEAVPHLRGVKVSGADSIDPSQLWGPAEWRQLPTYRLTDQASLKIEELYRGEVNPPANSLGLERTIWIDFDGEGATVRDNLNGTVERGWRLSVAEEVALGRATVNGRPQVISQLTDGSKGVEIRDSNIDIEAVSRFSDVTDFSATGWRHDIDSLSATLFLPPGWKLWHVAGPDRASNTWLSRWDLWDIFICLLVVVITANILRKAWAALSVILLSLIYHDASAPIFSCISLLFALAFLRVLPKHKFRQLVQSLCYGLGLVVLVSFLSFSVDAIRQSIYPQLEYMQEINRGYSFSSSADSYSSAPAALAKQSRRVMSEEMFDEDALGQEKKTRGKRKRYQATPENIQTGPGVPTWQWHKANLQWSGPVTSDENIELFLSPPGLTRLLRFLHVILIGAFSARLLLMLWRLRSPALKEGVNPRKPLGSGNTSVASFLLAGLLSVITVLLPVGDVHAADTEVNSSFPPKELLEEYERRLLKEPDCGATCYSVNRVQIDARQNEIVIDLKISVLETIGVPLPRFSAAWRPKEILVEGEKANRIFQRKGQWHVLLNEGVHEVTVTGNLYGEEFKLDFLQAHNIAVHAPGWETTGLIGNRLQSKSLTFSRKLDTKQVDTLFPDPIASHVSVHREFVLDRDWIVNTVVTRIAPKRGSINVNVPLLAGEKITVDGIESKDGLVAVSLGKKQRKVSWQSVIESGATYTIENQSGPNIVEHWSIEASSRWHLESEGITRVKTNRDGAHLSWRPWPGEKVIIRANKPTPVKGATTTVEAAKLHLSPGDRSSIAELNLTIRSSIGYDYELTPPVNAVLEKLTIDGADRVLPNPESQLSIPLHPGLQTVDLKWRLSEGVAGVTTTPDIILSSPPSNIDLKINMPRDRWPILVGGPAMGPAMLFWGVLVVMLFIATALSYTTKRFHLSVPLNLWQWALLILGMSTVNMAGSVLVFAWFFVFEARGRFELPTSRVQYNFMQLILILLSLASAGVLLSTIPESLLSYPDMQVKGNGSSNYLYRWYQDHTDGALPTGWVVSLPIWAYRAAMLLWSLWLVFALMRWIRWGWEKFCYQGAWRNLEETEKSDAAKNNPASTGDEKGDEE